jgi:hypothetical protein
MSFSRFYEHSTNLVSLPSIVITRLVRVIHFSAQAASWIARTSRAKTAEEPIGIQFLHNRCEIYRVAMR